MTLTKLKHFRKHFAAVFQPNHYIISPSVSEIKLLLDSSLPLTLLPKCFSPLEIKSYITNFLLGKSPGFNLITDEAVRKLPHKAIIHLTHIFNAILTLSYISV